MDIFMVLSLVGGLALFLYGMSVMGESLARLSGGKLEEILRRLTSNKFKGVLLGTLVTGIIQSSSATTVMVVGFVNSGIMKLGQSVGIIMGANIGTTVTSWLLSLTGISGNNIVLTLLKPSSFTPVLAAIGIILIMSQKDKNKKKEIGTMLLGFAVLMFGMEAMSGAVKPLANNESFTGILTMFSNPILGMLAGAALTAIIQSSSASVGILQALCSTGAVNFSVALPIIMGQNIGTCITAVISSIGATKNARRASMIHLYFNLLGTILFMSVFYALHTFINFSFLESSASTFGIAIIHTCFNVLCTIVFFPFSNLLVKLAMLTVRGIDENEAKELCIPADLRALDERFLENTALATSMSRQAVNKMAEEMEKCLNFSLDLFDNYSKEGANEVRKSESLLDKYEDTLGTYLLKVSQKNVSQEDSKTISLILHCSSDIERISDHSVNIVESIEELKSMGSDFSKTAKADLLVLMNAVRDIVKVTTKAFINGDIDTSMDVEPLEEVIDNLNIKLRNRYIDRLKSGVCKVETGVVFEDLITNLERISDHCSNIAVCLIEVADDDFETHEYVDYDVRRTDRFIQSVKKLSEKYPLAQA